MLTLLPAYVKYSSDFFIGCYFYRKVQISWSQSNTLLLVYVYRGKGILYNCGGDSSCAEVAREMLLTVGSSYPN